MRMRRFSVDGRALSHLALLLTVALALGAAACGDNGPRYPSCTGDKECRRSEHCVDRQCRQCASDRHCRKGETCIDGGCVLRPGACRSDSDCGNGRVCLGNLCLACEEDGQCGANRRCQSGRCIARGSCAQDEDCADDEDCLAGRCQGPERDKPPDVDCRLEPIYFAFDESSLSPAARNVLNEVAECVQAAPGRGVFLNGHTDPQGTEEYNIALSERRAEIVADYLARLGIDPARFRVIAKGETQASGIDESSWSHDRRVEIEWQ